MQSTNSALRIEVEEISQVKKKLSIQVPTDEVAREIDAAYKDIRANAKIAGFRKGTVPIGVIKARFADTVRQDVTAKLIEKTCMQALEEKRLTPVEKPKVESLPSAVEEGKDFSYSVTVEVNPSVEIKGYLGMPVKKEKVEVTDADIDAAVKAIREARARYEEADRAAAEGDLVSVDFEGSVNGKPLENFKAKAYPFILADKEPLPGFREAVKGLKKGEKKEIEVSFPENISEKKIAGKKALFAITLNSVREKRVPEIDDAFAKELNCENAAALRDKIREETLKSKESSAKEALKNRILDKLIEDHPFDVPEALVNRYLTVILNNVVGNIRSGASSPEDRNLTPTQLRDKYRIEAMRRVREDIILDHISAKENVQISEDETQEAIKKLAEARGLTYEALYARIMGEGSLDIVMDGLKHEKVFDKIIEAGVPA